MEGPQILWALVAIVGVQVVTVAALLGLGQRERAVLRSLPYLVSAAAGVLLSTACLDLLPEAVRLGGTGPALWNILLFTLLALFCVQAVAHALAERALRPELAETDSVDKREPDHTHNHDHGHGRPRASVGPLPLLLGSALHSAVDGIAIAAAFEANRRSGWIAAIAVGMHELPHRTGDFALLLHMGLNKRRAAQFAIAAGAAAVAGWAAVALLGSALNVKWLLPVSAATFLYIALVDLLPELHATRQGRRMWWQILCLGAGAAIMATLVHLPGAE